MVADVTPEAIDQESLEDATAPIDVTDPPSEAAAAEDQPLSLTDALRKTCVFNLDRLSTEALISPLALGSWTLLSEDDEPPQLHMSDEDITVLAQAVQALVTLQDVLGDEPVDDAAGEDPDDWEEDADAV